VANPTDARAPYYLGNLLYDWQPEEAVVLWEKSSVLDPNAPITWRNLAIAYSHQTAEGSKNKAIACLEKATSFPNPCPAHFSELDQLYKSEGASVEKRLALLEKNQKVVMKKDDALGTIINLKIFAGKTDESISLLKGRTFSIWEGGNAFNTGQAWADAHLIRGLNYLRKKQYQNALTDFQNALVPPENLRAEGSISRLDQIKYWMGCAFDALGKKENATQLWKEVAALDTLKNIPWRMREIGNRQTQRYFAAMARQKIDPKADVKTTFCELSDNDKNMVVGDSGDKDYQFIGAKKLPSHDDRAFPHYLSGLGYLGLGNKTKAKEQFNAALQISPDFLSAKIESDQF
jgi:tetratricopeptide (TPR) repeat protein